MSDYDFDEQRKELREKYLTEALLKNTPTTFMVAFAGSGDSGDIYDGTGHKDLDDFFDEVLREKVTFDWYNNEGGGGDISWDLHKDEITINGYYNVTEEVTIMDGVTV